MAENDLPNGQAIDSSIGDRSLTPEGHEVHAKDLVFAQSALMENLLRRFVDSSRAGVAYGLTVQISSPVTSRVDVIVDPSGSGWAYTPSGHLIEIPTSQTNIALADPTNGVENWICAIYTEEQSENSAHETDGVSRPTRAERSFRIRAITAAEYAALPDTSADLSVDAKDRLVVLATVLGNGALTALNANELVQQTAFKSIRTAVLTSPITATGCELVSISSQTEEGAGQLRLTVATGPVYTLFWTAPGDTIGAATAVSGDDVYTVVSANTTDSVQVKVIASLLPVVAANYDHAFTVSAFYEDVAPRWSPRDYLHASKVGAALPTENNPHGTGADDIGQHIVDFPQVIRLGTGYMDTEQQSLVPRITTEISTAALSDRTLLWEVPGVPANGLTRFYKTSATGTFELVHNARWDGTQWVKDTAAFDSSFMLFSPGGIGFSSHEGATTPFAPAAITSLWTSSIFDLSTPQGLLRFAGLQAATAAEAVRPRVQVFFNPTNTRTLMAEFVLSTGVAVATRLYAGTNGLEITTNARWDGTNFNQDEAALQSTLVTIGPGISSQSMPAGTLPWPTFTGQDFSATGATGASVTSDTNFRADALSTFDVNTARFLAQRALSSGTAAGQRILWSSFQDTTSGIRHREYHYVNANTFRTEKTIGCYWDGFNWRPDTTTQGSAVLLRFGSAADGSGGGGCVKFTKVGPFLLADTWADESADPTPLLGTSGWDSCDRAYGRFQTDGAGGFTYKYGFNYDVSIPSSTVIEVSFRTPMNNGDYAIFLTDIDDNESTNPPTTPPPRRIETQNRTTTGFEFRIRDDAGGDGLQDFSVAPTQAFNLLVIGDMIGF